RPYSESRTRRSAPGPELARLRRLQSLGRLLPGMRPAPDASTESPVLTVGVLLPSGEELGVGQQLDHIRRLRGRLVGPVDDLGFGGHWLHRTSEFERSMVRQNHVMELRELAVRTEHPPSRRVAALQHQAAEDQMAQKQAARRVGEACWSNLVSLD